MSSMADLVYELPRELANDLRHRHLGPYAHGTFAAWRAYMPTQENIKFGVIHSPAPSLPSRNQIMAIAVKKHAKVDGKLFLSSPILLDFSILFQILCPGL